MSNTQFNFFKKNSFNKQSVQGQKSYQDECDEEVFLRNDVNKMFDTMMGSADFNLKKYNCTRQIQTKKNPKKQSLQLKIHNASVVREKRMSTDNSHIQGMYQNIMPTTNKKTQQCQSEGQKKFLKTDNLNKLLKKKDSFSIANIQPLKMGIKTMTKNFKGTSTNLTNKNQQNDLEFSSQKNLQSSQAFKFPESKNVRKKIMSMTSKGAKVQRFQTQNKYENKTVTINFNHKQRVVTQNTGQHTKDNKYKQLQKKYNKGGPLKFKHVQNWLNNIIQEYCHDQYFDTSLTSAALKKYYIDSNSLMANGVDPNDVNRIYNSLFVYSIGFNNLIKQISKGNRQLVKNIWKVFSLLLEYCAAGNYETLVGQIERDKLQKVEELKVQIERRQQIIQKNQEINQQKNMTMYKELKRLKDQNINLANQREILMQDFQQADQAFNEQVSLRLKFQNTINQIYGVHKQLSNKHGRLFHDFQTKMQDLKKASQKYFQQTKTTQKYKYELIQLKQKFSQLSKINNHDKEHIDVLLEELTKMKQMYFEALKQLQKAKYINIEKDRKLEQVLMELNNNKIILQLREKSAKQTHQEYQITLEENNKLFQVISEQRVQMQGLLKQKKQFNQNVLKILGDSSYYKKKLESADKEIKILKQKSLQLQMALHKSEVQNQIHIKDLQSHKNDLQNNYESIKKMHQKNFDLQEELQFLRKYQGNMDHILEQKNIMIKKLTGNVDQLGRKLSEQTNNFMQLESKNKILQTQFRAQKESNFKRVEDLKKQQQKMSTNQTSLSKVLTTTHIQLQRYKNLFNDALMNFKNQKFERGNLTLAYEQILKVLQKKNAQEKQASIKINELQEQVNEYKQKYKLTHLNLINTTEQLNLKIKNLKQKNTNQQDILNYKAHHYHPMTFQDLFHKHQRQIQNHINSRKLMESIKKQAFSEKYQLQKVVKKIKLDLEFEIDKGQKKLARVEQKMKSQIQYQKQQNQKITKRLSALQILESTYKDKVKHFQQKQVLQQNEQKMMNQIKQKNQKINALYEEIQKIHDLKREQIIGLQGKIKQVEDQKMNFVYEFKTKKQRQMREELDKKYQQQIQKLKTQYQSKLKSGRSKLILPSAKNIEESSPEDEAFQRYFKELVKTRTLEQILNIKKEQFEGFNQTQNNTFYDQIQNFFRRSVDGSNHQLFNRTNHFSSSKGSTQKDFARSGNKQTNTKIPAYLQKMGNNSQEHKKRTSMSRKLRNAYDYYNKQTSLPK